MPVLCYMVLDWRILFRESSVSYLFWLISFLAYCATEAESDDIVPLKHWALSLNYTVSHNPERLYASCHMYAAEECEPSLHIGPYWFSVSVLYTVIL